MKPLTVSQLAKAAGVGTETVRHYETIGLLPPAQRGGNGYRLFPADTSQRMGFIQRAKSLGFGLAEIAELLALSDRRRQDCHTDMVELRNAARGKLLEIESRMKELQQIHQGLQQLIGSCPGSGKLADCPILTALSAPARLVHASGEA